MTDYTKLVAALRETSMDFGELDDVSVMLLDAAAAIEALQAKYEDERQTNIILTGQVYELNEKVAELKAAQPHWVSVEEPPKDKQECFVAFKGPLGFVYDTGRFYDDLNSGLDEDIFEDGTSGFVLGGEVGYALGSIDYWMPIEPPQEDA